MQGFFGRGSGVGAQATGLSPPYRWVNDDSSLFSRVRTRENNALQGIGTRGRGRTRNSSKRNPLWRFYPSQALGLRTIATCLGKSDGMLNIAVVAALLVVFGATAGWAQAPGQADMRLGIPYGPDPAQQLDLCLPANKQAAGSPAVVMIHGGYWTLGDKGADDPLCKGAAEQGIVAATIGYRLANTSEHNRWPAQLVDAQLAVRWLRSHAAEFGVDPSRICALGDSAGAHLAVFLAVLNHTVPGDYSGQLPNVSSRVTCAVDNFGPVDLSADSYWPPDLALFGNADRAQVKDQERAASPIFLVGRDRRRS
jgi:acetyl esterase/lipase